MSRNVTINGENGISEVQKVLNEVPFPETSDLQSFQSQNNSAISTFLTEKYAFKRRKGPYYRSRDKNLKSVKQYWKERNRRKQVWKLSCDGLTYPQIAKKLGVSAKTVQRDMKKVEPYHKGIIIGQLRELEQKRWLKFNTMLDQMTLGQRLRHLTNIVIKQRKQKRGREYRRHLVKVFINMDNMIQGIPRITHWPKRIDLKMTMPMHLKFFVVIDKMKLSMGGLEMC